MLVFIKGLFVHFSTLKHPFLVPSSFTVFTIQQDIYKIDVFISHFDFAVRGHGIRSLAVTRFTFTRQTRFPRIRGYRLCFRLYKFCFWRLHDIFRLGNKRQSIHLKMSDIQSFAVIYLLLAGFCCISMGDDQCIPAKGYEGCACYRETVNKTKEYVNFLPLKTDSSTPRYVSSSDSCNLHSVFVSKRG